MNEGVTNREKERQLSRTSEDYYSQVGVMEDEVNMDLEPDLRELEALERRSFLQFYVHVFFYRLQ